MSAHYDVIVLGAGLSGYVAAIRVAQLSKNIQSGSPAVRQCGQRTAANPVHNFRSTRQPVDAVGQEAV
ncbi:hypothetical protein ACWD3P_31470 [Streptomyces sp. NPDC002765]|uniref:hypothetical protein n=1 Tax=Streptomyces sp. C1-1 TaxID=3231173 RepID=UPI003D07AD58